MLTPCMFMIIMECGSTPYIGFTTKFKDIKHLFKSLSAGRITVKYLVNNTILILFNRESFSLWTNHSFLPKMSCVANTANTFLAL
jgi:hypothetical protein